MKILYIPFKKNAVPSIIIIVLLVVLFFFLGWNQSIVVLNNMFKNPIYKGNENISKVAFECNVVWGTEYIPAMLDIFKDRDINITFFIGGEWAKENPELITRMVSEGHEIGNHGYSHKHHSKLTLEQNLKEMKDTENIIKEITGITTTLFAPPYGEFDDTTLRAATSLGYKTIMWSIDTIDWKRDGVNNILDRVLKNPHNGAFVLMHPTEDTIKALPVMLDKLNEKGYDICCISELLE
jgi:probable sporulation protein (polysaccharide deacetylase family)